MDEVLLDIMDQAGITSKVDFTSLTETQKSKLKEQLKD